MPELERAFFMIKPDGVRLGLEARIFKRVEAAGLKVVSQKITNLTLEEAEELYLPHQGKKFYDGLVKFITSGPVVCSVVEGEGAVSRLRDLMGVTDPREAEPGTLRADFKEDNIYTEDGILKNIVHGSDSADSAQREIGIFFNDK